MNRYLISLLFLASLTYAACTTTAKMMEYVKPGQTNTEVVRLLGQPREVAKRGDSIYYFFKFKNSAEAPVSGGSTRYYVLIKDGKVIETGPRRILGF